MIEMQWAKSPTGEWHTLTGNDFSKIQTVGVYHIWCVGPDRNVNIRSGQGIVGARLMAHKADANIMRHARNGVLYVTWAAVSQQYLDRVERYLADQFRPVEGDRFPDVAPLAVRLPGQ